MKKHKYFRNLEYKQKLERLYNNASGYPSQVKFITEEVDYAQNNKYCWYNPEWDRIKNSNKYCYYDRPEVKYSIIRTNFNMPVKKRLLKKQATRKVRHNKDLYNNCLYKKLYDIQWELY